MTLIRDILITSLAALVIILMLSEPVKATGIDTPTWMEKEILPPKQCRIKFKLFKKWHYTNIICHSDAPWVDTGGDGPTFTSKPEKPSRPEKPERPPVQPPEPPKPEPPQCKPRQ